MSLARRLYARTATLATPLVRWHLHRRAAAGKEDIRRLGERLGHAGQARPTGALAWLHAASMGEVKSILPLAERLVALHRGAHVLITTGTVTSANLVAQQIPARVLHQFAPVDLPAAAERFLDHWRPDLVVWTESEFWPNLIAAIERRGLPLVLVNGRVSERTARRWQRFPRLIREMLAAFAVCLGQTPEDARRLQSLGARRALCVGNLKFSAPALPVDDAEAAQWRGLLADRPHWLAASTHPGEEAIAVAAHHRLARDHANLLTLIVPRHPERGAEVAELVRAAGLTVAQRSRGEALGAATAVYVADTIGELGLWYRLAEVVFVGGSLTESGGHNPLEPARLGTAIVHGPGMSAFAEIAHEMTAAGASLTVANGDALAGVVGELLFGDAAQRRRMIAAARAYAEGQAGALDRVLGELQPFTGQLAGGRA